MLNVSFLFILLTCSTVADKSPHLHLQPDLSKKSCTKRLYLILKFLSFWEVVTLPPITPLPPSHSTILNPPPPRKCAHTQGNVAKLMKHSSEIRTTLAGRTKWGVAGCLKKPDQTVTHGNGACPKWSGGQPLSIKQNWGGFFTCKR